jgi:hypothetical protein
MWFGMVIECKSMLKYSFVICVSLKGINNQIRLDFAKRVRSYLHEINAQENSIDKQSMLFQQKLIDGMTNLQ